MRVYCLGRVDVPPNGLLVREVWTSAGWPRCRPMNPERTFESGLTGAAWPLSCSENGGEPHENGTP